MSGEPRRKKECNVVEPQILLLREVWDIFLKSLNCGGSTPSAVPMLNTLGVRKMQFASGLNGSRPKFQSPKVINSSTC